MQQPYRLTIRVTRGMQLVQILFALPFTVLSVIIVIFMAKFGVDVGGLFAFLICAGFAYLGWANALSTIQIDEQSVSVTVFYGRFRIGWDEVETMRIRSPFIALAGNGKRLVLSLAFAGKNRQQMLDYLYAQAEQRHIPIEENADFPLTHQNARF